MGFVLVGKSNKEYAIICHACDGDLAQCDLVLDVMGETSMKVYRIKKKQQVKLDRSR